LTAAVVGTAPGRAWAVTVEVVVAVVVVPFAGRCGVGHVPMRGAAVGPPALCTVDDVAAGR
jgi:hypothetical protein